MIRNILKKIFNKTSEPEDAENVERLRIDFKERYHHFKLLLNANNKSLEIMAAIEQVLQGNQPFGMSFVRSNATAVSVNVFNMIQNIDRLAPQKYSELYNAFNSIREAIDHLLSHRKPPEDRRLVIPLSDVNKDMPDIVGSKMANIGELRNRLCLSVPDGFVITSYAYQKFLEHNELQAEIDRLFQSATLENMEALYNLSTDIQQMIIRSEIPESLANEMELAWQQIEKRAGKTITVSLRSSALGEDESESSFAGQYRSELNVSHENIFHAYKGVVASKYSLQAITYRLNKGFRDEDISMCVGCMVMVDAMSGGVMYSRNPVSPRDHSIFINSVWGLPKSVVDGSDVCDLFVVSRQNPMTVIRQDIQKKDMKFVCFPEEGVCRMDLTGDDGALPSLTPDQAIALAEIAIRLENYYGSSQDIEWAIDSEDRIYLLQCRPLQQLADGIEASFEAIDDSQFLAGGGITASPGAACGEVYKADRGIDILQFPEGGILVVRQALPRWASLLNRAAAVVTEQGGFAGHLANVAREFGIPALFGIPNIMNKLNPGEVATVDASGRAIYRGKIESLLVQTPRKNLMEGSPVYDTLKSISQFIVPLNLLDPDAHEFHPSKCRTFHDITRFIHEKAVHEMFNFGKEHNFSERSSKQLHYNVPMQWWVLNLDDGFSQEVKGKYIKLENICSIPMHAFWRGLIAVPWAGPPVDGKGLMEIMLRSTQNTALNVGVKSQYAERNYFMISKHYCNLSQRLGYHFSTLETLVSDRSVENYISFQFKGGAADSSRRIKRVRFVKDILEEFGFRVEVKEDTLIARIEGYDRDFMEKRLEMIGYLSLHTRQLDMIMENPARVNYYASKMRKDIRESLHILN